MTGISEQTLTQLGLTKGQAKVYLTLAILEKATAKEISSHSNIARQEVYRLLAELQEKSLIERVVASPTRFKAVPIEQGLPILIKRKEKEISKIKKEANEILKDFKKNNAKPTLDEKETQFVLIPGKEVLILRLKKMTETTEKTIDMIAESQSFGRALFELSGVISKALRKGVRIRVIVDNPEGREMWKKAVQELTNTLSCKLRTLTITNSLVFVIYDKKELIMKCFPGKSLAESPALWSNNPNLIEIFQNYFETMWKKAT